MCLLATQKACIATYGFISDLDQPLWKNVSDALGGMNPAVYFSKPSNRSFHNLCTHLTAPRGTAFLLGLGHKFCIEKDRPTQNWLATISRFKQSIRCRNFMVTRTKRQDNNENGYIKELYIPSQRKDWPPADPDIELRMMSFANRLERAHEPMPH
jgi:hypothetical protein